MALSRQRPRTWLSSEQGYELARVGTKMGLPVDLQRLIWADVTENYYSRGSVIDRAARVLQVAWCRLRAIIRRAPNDTYVPTVGWKQIVSNGGLRDGPDSGWMVTRYSSARQRFLVYMRSAVYMR